MTGSQEEGAGVGAANKGSWSSFLKVSILSCSLFTLVYTLVLPSGVHKNSSN
jgi:hypothetical protein